MNLDRLEQTLETAIRNETAANLSTADLNLPSLPEFVWPGAGLVLANINCSRVSETEMTITGSTTLKVIGDTQLALRLRTQGEPSVEANLTFGDNRSFKELLTSVLADIAVLNDVLATIDLADLDWEIPSPDSLVVQAQLRGKYEIPLAGASLNMTLDRARLEFGTAATELDISGRLSIGDLVATLIIELNNGKLNIAATFEGLRLRQLIEALALPLPALPPLDILDEAMEVLDIIFLNQIPTLVFHYDTPVGPANCVIAQVDGEWRMVAGLHAENLRFSSLNSALTPLDALLDVVAFGDPALTVSSHTLPAFPFPDARGTRVPKSFQQGIHINGELLLKKYGLEIFDKLFGIGRLPLVMPVAVDCSQVRISASVNRSINFFGDTAKLSNFMVTISPDPLRLSAAGEVVITLFGSELPQFRLGANVGPGTADLFLAADEPWEEPLGIPVVIKNLGLQVSSAPAYGVFGKVMLQDRTIDVATQFIGQVPALLAGSLEGDMPLSGVLLDLIGVDLLPDYIEPTLRNFDMYVVINPAGASVGERLYPFGLSLRGTLTFLGLGLTTDLHISKTRVIAKGELDRAIRIDPVFRFSGNHGAKPSVAIDTLADPIVKLDGKIMFLGLEKSVEATLSSAGFSTTIEDSLGGVESRLAVTLGDGRVEANGEATCMVTGKIGPIRLFSNGPDLGTIRIDTGAELTIFARAEESSALQVRAAGRVIIIGLDIRLPEFSANIESIDRLPAAILEFIQRNAVELLADILSDVDKWLQAVADKLIESVEDVARTLKEHFQKTSKQIASAMIDVLEDSLETTAKALRDIGETAENIGRIFSELGKEAEDIAKALKAIGTAPEVIGKVLKEIGRGVEDVGQILKKVGFPDEVVDTAVKLVFIGIPGVGWPPHIKHIKLPHVKHVKLPHVKHVKLPHVKHIKAPHIKHIKIF